MAGSAKQKLARGEVVTLINPDHPSPGIVEVIAGFGIDAVFIDCEHGTASLERVEDMVRAAHLAQVSAIVRTPSIEPWVMVRCLDRGADGVMVPRVDTEAIARQVVETVRYACVHDHAAKIILAQIESVMALENLDGILTVDEIDAFVIGPDDLSRSMGFPGQQGHPTVQKTVDETIARICEAGRVPGTVVTTDSVRAMVGKGVRLLYNHANTFLDAGAKQFLTAVAGA